MQDGVKRGILAVLAVVTVGAAAFAIGRSAATNTSTVAANASAAATSAAGSGDASTAVQIKDFSFGPATVTVKAGTSVTWTNEDGTDHSIKSANGAFDSQDVGQGQTFRATFSTPGSFNYICGIHHSMMGTVVVTS